MPDGDHSTGIIVRICDPTLHGNRVCYEVKITVCHPVKFRV